MAQKLAYWSWMAIWIATVLFSGGALCAQDLPDNDFAEEASDDEPSSDIATLESLVGEKITIELRSGRELSDVEFVGLERTRSGDPRRILYRERDRQRQVAISAIARVEQDDKAVYVAPQGRSRGSKQRPPQGPKPKVQTAKEREAWLARLAARNVEPWKEESDKEHAEVMAEYRQMIDEVRQLLPGTELYETERFLFTSNIPPQQIAPYVRYLDEMYNWMCEVYGVPQTQDVWLGRKTPVFAFLNEQEFHAFEAKYFQKIPEGIYGLCHQSSDGHVVIACYRGDDPHDFGQMLVHETSHGFIHRYKTKARLPNWVNEGMAEYIGARMVPKSDSVKKKELIATMEMRRRGTLGGDFFTTESIHDWQYGAASSINGFMIEANPESYVHFIEALKEGMPWVEALQTAYGSKPEELLQAYGQSKGVPNLQP
jgi:hypothetical protein